MSPALDRGGVLTGGRWPQSWPKTAVTRWVCIETTPLTGAVIPRPSYRPPVGAPAQVRGGPSALSVS
jgi:hypothetical protein